MNSANSTRPNPNQLCQSDENIATLPSSSMNAPDQYINLLKRCLTAQIYDESAWSFVTEFRSGQGGLRQRLRQSVIQFFRRRGYLIVRPLPFDAQLRNDGRDWPCFGYSMIGMKRMDNIEACVRTVLAEDVAGDLIETGVWRGGSTILMRAILQCFGVTDRTVWVADSFEGLPKPSHSKDRSDPIWDLSECEYLKVSEDQVKSNFARFGLLDNQVRFLKGWFKDTLSVAPIKRLAVLRLDGDMFESTMDALQALYHKVSPGGFVIVDDYYAWPGCRAAVDEFRSRNNLPGELQQIDGSGVFWRLPRSE